MILTLHIHYPQKKTPQLLSSAFVGHKKMKYIEKKDFSKELK